jgi:ABC-type antimicrobial peptide transport system permease subunit
MNKLVFDVVVGGLFGGVVAWTVCAELYEKLTYTRGQPARSLPASFWRWSVACAAVGAVLGGILMWRVIHGG